MTDRSNYGPVRRLSPSASTNNRKPYSRTGLKGVLGTLDLNSGDTAVPTPSDSPYYPFHAETPQLEAPTQNRTSVPDGPRDIAGFPTHEQYQRIEGEYLSSLSERKQPKALISQALFDKIFAVLQNGSEERGSTAQFRFWVRKMFVLAYPQTSFNHNAGQTPEPVVLHDKRPVAIKEQIYEVLCYCHAVARHGGRDKTCATLRLNYSWVPKELTAKFVKACPTCTLKRSGNPDLLSQFGQTVSSSSLPYAPLPPTVTAPLEPASLPVFPGGPNDSPPPPPGLSFVVGSEGCDDGGGGGSSAGFSHSMFATPDLSVYPSPTLSAGSLGPTTPSPYLPSGLFGYPVVFDPGHGSLSSMAGWDTSCLSPCGGLMYPEELHAGISERQEAPMSAEEICCTQGMQLQLPGQEAVHHPLCTRAHGGDYDNGGGEDGECGGADPLPRIAGTQCTVDMNNIDPALLMEGGGGYSPFAPVGPGPTRTVTDDAEADSNSDRCVFQQQQQHYHHHHQQHDPHAPGQPPQQLGLALGTTTSSPGMGEPGPASISGQRQRRHDASSGTTMRTTATDVCSGSSSRDVVVPESLLSLPPPGASASSNSLAPGPMPMPAVPRGDNPLVNMIMFKFGPPPGVQVVAAPTPSTMSSAAAAAAAAGVLGMGKMRGIEVGENILLLFGRDDSSDDDHDRGAQEAQAQAREEDSEELQLQVEDSDANVNVFRVDNTETRTPRPLAVDVDEETTTAQARCHRCRWDRPEAWLVQSDSVDDEDVSVAAMA
jgi:hypothetical protein